MVTLTKRKSYVFEMDSSDEDSDYNPTTKHTKSNYVRKLCKTNKMPVTNSVFQQDNSDDDFKVIGKLTEHESRKIKSLSRNAIMARENRIKKKIYMQKLENQVRSLKNDKAKLTAIVDNQSFLISELKHEVKYVKSVLANSADISKLIKNIHSTTGMSVTTSLDKTLMLNNDCVSKHKTYIARKTSHPWEDCSDDEYLNIPAPEKPLSVAHFDFDVDPQLNLTDLDLPLDCDVPLPELLNFEGYDLNERNNAEINKTPMCEDTLQEHNYTTSVKDNEKCSEDVGICLHVSKHRVSLEFCSTCSENAVQTWKKM